MRIQSLSVRYLRRVYKPWVRIRLFPLWGRTSLFLMFHTNVLQLSCSLGTKAISKWFLFFRCDFRDFNFMGHHASPTLARGKLFVNVSDEPPFCDINRPSTTKSWQTCDKYISIHQIEPVQSVQLFYWETNNIFLRIQVPRNNFFCFTKHMQTPSVLLLLQNSAVNTPCPSSKRIHRLDRAVGLRSVSQLVSRTLIRRERSPRQELNALYAQLPR